VNRSDQSFLEKEANDKNNTRLPLMEPYLMLAVVPVQDFLLLK